MVQHDVMVFVLMTSPRVPSAYTMPHAVPFTSNFPSNPSTSDEAEAVMVPNRGWRGQEALPEGCRQVRGSARTYTQGTRRDWSSSPPATGFRVDRGCKALESAILPWSQILTA